MRDPNPDYDASNGRGILDHILIGPQKTECTISNICLLLALQHHCQIGHILLILLCIFCKLEEPVGYGDLPNSCPYHILKCRNTLHIEMFELTMQNLPWTASLIYSTSHAHNFINVIWLTSFHVELHGGSTPLSSWTPRAIITNLLFT